MNAAPPASQALDGTGPPRAGGTPLIHARELARHLGYARLFLKDEGVHPTGSHKHRAAVSLAGTAREEGWTGATVGTCGNFGFALASACQAVRVGCRVFLPRRYSGALVARMESRGARVSTVQGTYEDAVEASRKFAADEGFFDANPVGEGGAVAIEAFRGIAEEIVEALGGPPDTVLVPVGNGTTLVGLDLGLCGLGHRPRLIAVGSSGNTALTASIRAGRELELCPGTLRETPVNEPLVNWRSYHVREALDAVAGSGGAGHDVTDAELMAASAMVACLEGVRVSPAGAAGVAALASAALRLPRHQTHVAVLTSAL